MKDNLVIIRVDGGIGSQITFITLGLAFEEKGIKVKYDLSWFEESGKKFFNPSVGYDKDYDINFDIPKAFPTLSLEIASKREIEHYRKHYYIDDKDVIMCKPPLYVGGYLGRVFDVRYAPLLREHFKPQELQESNTPFAALLQEIESSPSPCGVHIRRGDLSQPHIVYGNPTSNEYFAKSIELMCLLHPQSSFYLFSDDLAFVKEQIVPLLKGKTYRICDVNNPTQGYLDLYLLSRCRNIIGSQGGMGVYAKILSPYNPLLVSPRYRSLFTEIQNIMCVNWGESVKVAPLVYTLPHHLSSKEMGRLICSYMRRKVMQVFEKFKIKRFINN
ncbi:MAG: alpha-1,2-fucosyltransferase [Helicobacter sp.]|uniref:alpha-1,2-fucosyltransferase n=1 Tax=Helicobacter sp. TaxID=218 RepID=UPI0023C48383|nr:alpha-1,2-fucosyltransferase [Helicobacter sp.]MDE7174549.1 alpha-1,2-fucosyltransferase [Helicobacter sp.]